MMSLLLKLLLRQEPAPSLSVLYYSRRQPMVSHEQEQSRLEQSRRAQLRTQVVVECVVSAHRQVFAMTESSLYKIRLLR